jgi:hypothetical protein
MPHSELESASILSISPLSPLSLPIEQSRSDKLDSGKDSYDIVLDRSIPRFYVPFDDEMASNNKHLPHSPTPSPSSNPFEGELGFAGDLQQIIESQCCGESDFNSPRGGGSGIVTFQDCLCDAFGVLACPFCDTEALSKEVIKVSPAVVAKHTSESQTNSLCVDQPSAENNRVQVDCDGKFEPRIENLCRLSTYLYQCQLARIDKYIRGISQISS